MEVCFVWAMDMRLGESSLELSTFPALRMARDVLETATVHCSLQKLHTGQRTAVQSHQECELCHSLEQGLERNSPMGVAT